MKQGLPCRDLLKKFDAKKNKFDLHVLSEIKLLWVGQTCIQVKSLGKKESETVVQRNKIYIHPLNLFSVEIEGKERFRLK